MRTKYPGIKIPRHVAIIMDGNGRWAKQRGLPRIAGHREGVNSIIEIMKACHELNIKYLTLFAFSTENWSRPESEVKALMNLLNDFIDTKANELHKYKIRLRVIGRILDLPVPIQRKIVSLSKATKRYKRQLILALSYGGRDEIVDATKRIATLVKKGKISPDRITRKTISRYLYAPDVPEPDLLIRTSGEIRISNFLLWQIAYTELYFTKVLWPDFRKAEFVKALKAYSLRKRRFGKTDEQLQKR
jgi:undecaprenyl diphosphate synthase